MRHYTINKNPFNIFIHELHISLNVLSKCTEHHSDLKQEYFGRKFKERNVCVSV